MWKINRGVGGATVHPSPGSATATAPADSTPGSANASAPADSTPGSANATAPADFTPGSAPEPANPSAPEIFPGQPKSMMCSV